LFDGCVDSGAEDEMAGSEGDEDTGEDPFEEVACERASTLVYGDETELSWSCSHSPLLACAEASDGTQVPYSGVTCPDIGYDTSCGYDYYVAGGDCDSLPQPKSDGGAGGPAGDDGDAGEDGGADGGTGTTGTCRSTASVNGEITKQNEFTERCTYRVQTWVDAPSDELLIVQMVGAEGETDEAGGTWQDVLILVIDDITGPDSLVRANPYVLAFSPGAPQGESFAFFQEVDILGGHSTHLDPSLDGTPRGSVTIDSQDGSLRGTFDITVRFFGGTDVRFQGEFDASASPTDLFEPAVR
jgi:hypothetical protein